MWMESSCMVVRENAGESVDSARLLRAGRCGEAAADLAAAYAFCCTFFQVSFSVTVRLNTGLPGALATVSQQK